MFLSHLSPSCCFFALPLSSSIFDTLFLISNFPHHSHFSLSVSAPSMLVSNLYFSSCTVSFSSLFPYFHLPFPHHPPTSFSLLPLTDCFLTDLSLPVSLLHFLHFPPVCRAAQLMATFLSFIHSLLLYFIYPSIHRLYSFSWVYPASSTPCLAISISQIPPCLSLHLLPSYLCPPPPAERNSSEEGCLIVEGL